LLTVVLLGALSIPSWFCLVFSSLLLEERLRMARLSFSAVQQLVLLPTQSVLLVVLHSV
jgi:hypothetical protein